MPKNKTPPAVSFKRFMVLAEILADWKRHMEFRLDAALPGWQTANLMDVLDGERMAIHAYHLIQALRVTVLEEMEMTYVTERANRNAWKEGKHGNRDKHGKGDRRA